VLVGKPHKLVVVPLSIYINVGFEWEMESNSVCGGIGYTVVGKNRSP